jgi:hypothetical protein
MGEECGMGRNDLFFLTSSKHALGYTAIFSRTLYFFSTNNMDAPGMGLAVVGLRRRNRERCCHNTRNNAPSLSFISTSPKSSLPTFSTIGRGATCPSLLHFFHLV